MTDDVFTTVDQSWTNLLTAIDGIPADRVGEAGACGDWSVKDLAGHIAYWEGQAAIAAERKAAGEPAVENDWQAMNDADYLVNRDVPFQVLYDRLLTTHQATMATLQALPDVDPESVKEDTWEHYDEHSTQIVAWRAANGL